jgi:hypothetical protein
LLDLFPPTVLSDEAKERILGAVEEQAESTRMFNDALEPEDENVQPAQSI